MIIDLFELWKGPLSKKQLSLLPEKPESYSDGAMVSTFDLPKNVKIVFVANRKFTPVLNYQSLPNVELTTEEQRVVTQTASEIRYDGNHILLSGVFYDTEKNIVFIEAKKAKFSLVASLSKKKFSPDSPIWQQNLYCVGAIVPLITKDGHTVLLQSSKMLRYLSVAGYVEAKTPRSKLMDINTGLSLIEYTAMEELMEELLADRNLKSRIPVEQFRVSTISFRQPPEGNGFIEFFVAAELNCKLPQLARVIKTNKAPHRNEHTGEYLSIDLNSDTRNAAYEMWSKNTPGGRDLYPTTVRVASRIFNENYPGDRTQRFMPGARIESFPISFFKAAPAQSLNDKTPISPIMSKLIKADIDKSHDENLTKQRTHFHRIVADEPQELPTFAM